MLAVPSMPLISQLREALNSRFSPPAKGSTRPCTVAVTRPRRSGIRKVWVSTRAAESVVSGTSVLELTPSRVVVVSVSRASASSSGVAA